MYLLSNQSKVLFYKNNTEKKLFNAEDIISIAVEFPQDSTAMVLVHVFRNGNEIIALETVRAASEMTYYAYPNGIQQTYDNTLYHAAKKRVFVEDIDELKNEQCANSQYILYYHMVGNEIDFLGIDIQCFDRESNRIGSCVYHFFNNLGTLPEVRTENKLIINHYAKAKNGDSNSMFEIGYHYYKLYDLEDERIVNMISAIYWWQEAANKGHHLAIIYLTALYCGGEGLFSYDEGKQFRNDTMYVKYADIGGEEGLLYCLFCLGNISMEGLSEMGKNKQFAVKCWESVISTDIEYVKRTERDRSLLSNYRSILRSYHNLGVTYANGYGVAKDINKAIEYWKKAAEYGSLKSAKALIEIYEEGNLVPKNIQEAEYWFEVMRNCAY